VVSALIIITTLSGGCNHPGSKDDSSDTTPPVAVSELSPALAGKRIVVRGKLFLYKCGQGIGLENGQVICLVGATVHDPFAGADGKPLEVTGTLRFYHDSEQQHDHYSFEKETTQVRVMTEYMNDATVSSAGRQLTQALVGKRITIRGKLQPLGFQCGPSIALDDKEAVCLERRALKSGEDPYSVADPYSGMYGKRVEAIGTLRFFHDSTPLDENIAAQRIQDYYYFEAKTTQVRPVHN
jgi:hypothetical protein